MHTVTELADPIEITVENLVPARGHLLVRLYDPPQQTRGGIVLPSGTEMMEGAPLIGQVVSHGCEHKYQKEGSVPLSDYPVGCQVVVTAGLGRPIDIDRTKYVLLAPGSLFGRVER